MVGFTQGFVTMIRMLVYGLILGLCCFLVTTLFAAENSDLITMIEKSDCAKYKWKNRSVAPKNYIREVVTNFASQVCNPNQVVVSPLGKSDKDALVHYKLAPSLVNVYALLLGSGMRESSGNFCEGRDMSAKNVTAETAEAGVFQTSFNSRHANKELVNIFNKYKNQVCATTCSTKSFGTGDGFIFQERTKNCPAFAIEYAAVAFRTLFKHYGPIVRKEVEVRKECLDLLIRVEALVKPTCAK